MLNSSWKVKGQTAQTTMSDSSAEKRLNRKIRDKSNPNIIETSRGKDNKDEIVKLIKRTKNEENLDKSNFIHTVYLSPSVMGAVQCMG